MGNVLFGARQFSKPTPTHISNTIQVFTVIAGALIAWIGTANFIPAKLSGILQSILGLLLTIANGLKPFFGVETTQTNVPIADVSAMDETKS